MSVEAFKIEIEFYRLRRILRRRPRVVRVHWAHACSIVTLLFSDLVFSFASFHVPSNWVFLCLTHILEDVAFAFCSKR